LPEYTGKNANIDLEELANSFNLEVVQVKGDGNCMFRAVSKSLKLMLNQRYKHEELRNMAVKYLKDNPSFVEPYFEYVTDKEFTQKNVDKYIKKMALLSTWGDIIGLKVLSEILKVRFDILVLNTRNFQNVSNDDAFTTTIPLGFIDDYHYTALKQTSTVQLPWVKPSAVPSVKPFAVPSAVPSVKPSAVPSVKPSAVPSVKPSAVPSVKPSAVPSIAPNIPPPVFGKAKPISNVNELLELMDKVKPLVYDDIAKLLQAEKQIMVSLGM
jgi:hypothetical protein